MIERRSDKVLSDKVLSDKLQKLYAQSRQQFYQTAHRYEKTDKLFIFLFLFVGICFFLILGMEWGRRIERGKTIGMKREITTGSLEQHKDAKKRANQL